MNETLEQKVLRIAKEVKGEHGDLNTQIVEFARRLLAETGQGEPVAFATNGYGKISLYWREGLVIDFIPNGTTIGLYASPQLQAETGQEPVAWKRTNYPQHIFDQHEKPVDGKDYDAYIPLYASPQLPPGHVAVPREPTDEELEIGRKAIEDALIEWRDSRLSEFHRANGLVIKEKDGTESSIIRFGPETALRIGMRAILAAHEEKP